MLKQLDSQIANSMFQVEADRYDRNRSKLLGKIKELGRDLAMLESDSA